MPKKTKPLYLYTKFLELLLGNSEWGETDSDQISVTVSRQFKLSKKEINKELLPECEKMGLLTTKKRHNGPTSIFIKQGKVA